jgi:hypothetical protein
MRGLLSSWQMHACTHRLYHGWFVISHGRTGALVTPLVTTPLTPCRPSLPVLPHRTRPCQHDVQCQRTAQCGGPNSAGIHPASSPAVLKEAILQWACVDAQETVSSATLLPDLYRLCPAFALPCTGPVPAWPARAVRTSATKSDRTSSTHNAVQRFTPACFATWNASAGSALLVAAACQRRHQPDGTTHQAV